MSSHFLIIGFNFSIFGSLTSSFLSFKILLMIFDISLAIFLFSVRNLIEAFDKLNISVLLSISPVMVINFSDFTSLLVF